MCNDGGPAFPGNVRVEYGNGQWDMEAVSGMTPRDYFAARAMTSHQLISNVGGIADNNALASAAYKLADAMLKARGEDA